MTNTPKQGWRVTLKFFFALLLYWLLLALLDRLAFTLTVASHIENKWDIVLAFLFGLRLDASLIAYLMVLPFLGFFVQQLLFRRPLSPWFLRIYVMIPTFLFAAISVVNIPLYAAWGEKISKRALLLGMENIGGVINSLDGGMILPAILFLGVFFTCAHYTYHLLVVPRARFVPLSWKTGPLYFVLGVLLIFTCIRGGYGRAVINPSAVYFSEDNRANHIAVTTYWAFLKDLTSSSKKNPYPFMTLEEAEAIVKTAVPSTASDSIPKVLTSDRPNVLLVILEGVVGQVFEDLGGEKAVTPGMTKLMREGVNFTHAYAAADRSDKGMIAVLSGFPAQGPESIIKHIPKHEKLPAIGQLYDSIGYHTAFYHGGQSEFYNFKSYMLTHGIHQVVDNANFPLQVQRTSWGVYDHVVAQRMERDLRYGKQPFFSIFYTLTNHEPFDLSPSYQFGNDSKANAYRSTAYYTDSMLYNLVDRIKQEPWYANTLVLVTSDHGHVYPLEKYGLEHPERYRIPLFLFGGALKAEWRGRKMEEVVSQVDIVATLAHFVGLSAERFPYSQDLFAQDRGHTAFFNANNNFGLIGKDAAVSYDLLKQGIGYSTLSEQQQAQQDSLLHTAQGYYQKVFADFLTY